MRLTRPATLALGALLALSASAAAAPPKNAGVKTPPAPEVVTAAAAKPKPAPPAASAPSMTENLDAIAAVVNDEVVLRSDVEEQLFQFLKANKVLHPDSIMVDTLRKQILEQLVDEKLLVAEARRQGVTIADAELDKQVEQAIKDAKDRMGGEAGYREQLAKENLTEAKLHEKFHTDIERAMLAERLKRRQFPHKPVLQAEAEAFFRAHSERFPLFPAQVRLAVIQIPVVADSAALAKAKRAALEARQRILAGEKFAKVAQQLSEDTQSAQAGGDLGYFPRGTMDPEFEKTAFSVKLNSVSAPVLTPFGWHLIEVLDRDTLKTRAGRDTLDRDGKPLLEAHARHILFRVAITDADAERSRKLAERVRAEAVKGTDFGTLVRRYSRYQGQQTEDGDVGFVPLNTLQPSIREGLDTLETAEISQPLPNQIGYNIFKVLDRKPERPYTLEEIKADLPQAVEELKNRDRYEEWVKVLRSKSHIEIRNG